MADNLPINPNFSPINPFQTEVTGQGPYNAFSEGIKNFLTEKRMAPFREMELQRQQMGLQETQQQHQEFMSPGAQEARTSLFGKQSAENKLAGEKARAESEILPITTQQHIQEAQQHLAETKGKPAGMIFEALGNAFDAIHAAPEGMKPHLYNSIIEGVKRLHPGMEFPDVAKEWSPEVESSLGALRYAQIHTKEHAAEMEKQELIALRNIEAAREQAKGRIGQGQAIAAGHIGAAEINAERASTGGAELARLRKIISDPTKGVEVKRAAIDQMEMAAAPIIEAKIEKDWGNKFNAAILGPEKEKVREQGIQKDRKQMRLSYGLDVQVTAPNGTRGTIPRRNLEEALKNGYKEVK